MLLKSQKKKTIINFLATYPTIVTKAAKVEDIQSSFIKNGLLDSNTKVWPDINGLINTMGKTVNQDEVSLIMSSFEECYKCTMMKGYIDEELFEKLKDIKSQLVSVKSLSYDISKLGEN